MVAVLVAGTDFPGIAIDDDDFGFFTGDGEVFTRGVP